MSRNKQDRNKVKVPDGYRLLGKDEIIQEGDLVSGRQHGWVEARLSIGHPLSNLPLKGIILYAARKIKKIQPKTSFSLFTSNVPKGYEIILGNEYVAKDDLISFDCGNTWNSIFSDTKITFSEISNKYGRHKTIVVRKKEEDKSIKLSSIPDGYFLLSPNDPFYTGDLISRDGINWVKPVDSHGFSVNFYKTFIPATGLRFAARKISDNNKSMNSPNHCPSVVKCVKVTDKKTNTPSNIAVVKYQKLPDNKVKIVGFKNFVSRQEIAKSPYWKEWYDTYPAMAIDDDTVTIFYSLSYCNTTIKIGDVIPRNRFDRIVETMKEAGKKFGKIKKKYKNKPVKEVKKEIKQVDDKIYEQKI